MAAEAQLRKMVQAIHAQPELYGCKVVYVHLGKSRILHEGIIPAVAYDVVVVIEEGAPGVPRSGGSQHLNAPPAVAPGGAATNASKLGAELVGLGLSCGFATISVVGVVGGAAAEVPTGGASTVLLVLSWTGMLTAGAQCLNGAVRVGEIIRNPDATTLATLDENDLYKYGILIIDAIGVAGGLAALPFGVKNLLAILERRGGLATLEKLRGMPDWQRKAAVEKALKEASKTDAGRDALKEAMKQAGLKENQIAHALRDGLKTHAQIALVNKALKAETAKRLNSTLRDLMGAGGGFGASATPDTLVGSASGSVNWVIVHVFQAVQGKKP